MNDFEPAILYGGILVGGTSRRMGAPKALLRFAGETFFDRVAVALAPSVARTVVLGRGAVPPTAARFEALDDLDAAGPLGGLLAAFAFAPAAAWIVAACDLPLLTADAVHWLVAQRSPAHWAVLPRLRRDHVEPLAALYEPAAAQHLRALAATGVSSLQPLADLPGVATPTPPHELAASWRNVNTPAELAGLGGSHR